jgi:bla regulator protein blaR1
MLIYCLQLTLFWAFGFAFYWLTLRKLTFFQANRVWILAQLIIGPMWPLIMQWLASKSASSTIAMIQLPLVEITAQTMSGWQKATERVTTDGSFGWLAAAYVLISAALLAQFIYQVVAIRLLCQSSSVVPFKGEAVIVNAAVEQPFSFGNTIFLPKTHAFSDTECAQILLHESYHIAQRHTLDIVLCALLRCAFWWNPFVYLWKHALTDVHEFGADQHVLNHHALQQYGRLLLGQVRVATAPMSAPVHSIFQSPIQKRIDMMTSPFSARAQSVRYALFLPFLMLLHTVMLQAQSGAKAKVTHTPVVSRDTIVVFDPATSKEHVKIVTNSYYKTADDLPVYGDCAPSLTPEQKQDCSYKNLMAFLVENLKYPADAKAEKVEGRVHVSFIIEEDGSARGVMIQKSLHPSCDKAVRDLMRLMGKWQPARIDGKAVPIQFVLPIKFSLSN